MLLMAGDSWALVIGCGLLWFLATLECGQSPGCKSEPLVYHILITRSIQQLWEGLVCLENGFKFISNSNWLKKSENLNPRLKSI